MHCVYVYVDASLFCPLLLSSLFPVLWFPLCPFTLSLCVSLRHWWSFCHDTVCVQHSGPVMPGWLPRWVYSSWCSAELHLSWRTVFVLQGAGDRTAILQRWIDWRLVLINHYCWYQVYTEAEHGWNVASVENRTMKFIVKCPCSMRPSNFVEHNEYIYIFFCIFGGLLYPYDRDSKG